MTPAKAHAPSTYRRQLLPTTSIENPSSLSITFTHDPAPGSRSLQTHLSGRLAHTCLIAKLGRFH